MKQQKDAIDTIHHSSEHLLTIINELLDLSRIEARKMELELADVYLPGFLKGIMEIARIRAKQGGVPFDCEIASDLPTGVRADEKRLRQVLLNLINNAIKFTEEGRVVFSVSVESRCTKKRKIAYNKHSFQSRRHRYRYFTRQTRRHFFTFSAGP